MDREPPKGSKWPAEGLHYTWGSTRVTVQSNLPGSAWLLGVEQRQVRYPAAAVLRLTWPREVGTFVLFPDVRQNPLWDTHFLPSRRRPFKAKKQKLA